MHGDELTDGAPPPRSELARLHGYELSPEERRLLRAPLPRVAREWCERVTGARVVGARVLDGGMSSAVYAVDLADGRALVLRRFVRAEWLAEEPDVPRREAAALELLRGAELPTPELVAVDVEGGEAGDPAVLMTRLPGAVEWAPRDMERFLRGLAGLLPRIHATPPGPEIPAYAPYPLEAWTPPAWTERPAIWERGFATFDEPPPASDPVLIHRDFHPGNVLWEGGSVTGVVDWANASVGAREADIGHCRVNLAGVFGLPVADRFLELCGVADYDPYWDIVAALGGFDDAAFARWTPWEEEFLARAVVRRSGASGAGNGGH